MIIFLHWPLFCSSASVYALMSFHTCVMWFLLFLVPWTLASRISSNMPHITEGYIQGSKLNGLFRLQRWSYRIEYLLRRLIPPVIAWQTVIPWGQVGVMSSWHLTGHLFQVLNYSLKKRNSSIFVMKYFTQGNLLKIIHIYTAVQEHQWKLTVCSTQAVVSVGVMVRLG